MPDPALGIDLKARARVTPQSMTTRPYVSAPITR